MGVVCEGREGRKVRRTHEGRAGGGAAGCARPTDLLDALAADGAALADDAHLPDLGRATRAHTVVGIVAEAARAAGEDLAVAAAAEHRAPLERGVVVVAVHPSVPERGEVS